MEGSFRFKQFSVAQDKCAMKVNTDGVLLGAWRNTTGAKHILDIGTGTGVLAMMMAQRNPDATMDAIDIDDGACIQAKENFLRSPWSKRLRVIHTSLQNFSTNGKYDVIISNPPYFIDDFKTSSRQKNIAKHSIALDYTDLVDGIRRLLAENGKALLVIPVFNFQILESIANNEGLFVVNLTEVIAVKGKPPYVVLIELGRIKKEFSKGILQIQNSDGTFTQQYMALTKDFYLKF